MTTSTGAAINTSRGWQIAALVFAMVFPSIGAWLYFVMYAGHESVRLAYGVTKVIQFAFPIVWVLLIERTAIRLRWPDGVSVRLGLAFGAVVLGAMLALYFGGFSQTGYAAEAREAVAGKLTDFGITTPLAFLGLAAFYCLLHSLLEEYYWRWFVFGRLAEVTPRWPAILLSSLAFAAHHVIVLANFFDELLPVVLLSLAVAVGGAVWAWLYARCNSLWGPWLSHLLVDAGIMAVGYHLVFVAS